MMIKHKYISFGSSFVNYSDCRLSSNAGKGQQILCFYLNLIKPY